MNPSRPERESLRDMIRAGDPARIADPLSPAETARLRARMLDAARAPGGSRFWTPTLAATAVAASIVLLVSVALWTDLRPPSAPGATDFPSLPPRAETVTGPRHPELLAARTALAPRHELQRRRIERPRPEARRLLYFTAPNGTRIIWNLRNGIDAPAAHDDSQPRS